jgi:hypothetical protein
MGTTNSQNNTGTFTKVIIRQPQGQQQYRRIITPSPQQTTTMYHHQ